MVVGAAADPLRSGWSLAWTIASVFALVYAVLTAVVTGDFLGVGGQFLTWLVVAKAFNRRAARDWRQIYLLAFLMLVAGSVLNPDLAYGLCFLGFVILDMGDDPVPASAARWRTTSSSSTPPPARERARRRCSASSIRARS